MDLKEISKDEVSFSQLITDVFGFETKIVDSRLETTIQIPIGFDENEEMKYEDKKLYIEITELRKKLKQCKKLTVIGETAIKYDNNYEFLVNFGANVKTLFIGSRVKSGDFDKIDNTNNISYQISDPTDVFLIIFLNQLTHTEKGFLRKSISIERIIRRQDDKDESFFNFLRKIFKPFLTVKISADKRFPDEKFEALGNAYLFQIGYNLNIPIIQIKFIEEFISPSRIQKMRRGKSKNIDPPRRTYIPELITHYQMAISTDSPALQYLSYYHIMEYFFETLSKGKKIETIRNEITKPGFSFSRYKDMENLIKIIQKDTQRRSEEVTHTERNALKLTIKTYVTDFSNIQNEIQQYNQDLQNYYKMSNGPFSTLDKVDISDPNIDILIDHLSKRIYNTRNAIVHSKESSDKKMYVPFRDDKDLIKEIPIIRFLAEEIIIASSPDVISLEE